MNKNPIVLKESLSSSKIRNIFLKKNLDFAPLISSKNKILKILTRSEIFSKDDKKNKKLHTPVVLMAGGEGTRLIPFTNILPKPLIPIAGKPMIEHILNRFVQQNFEKFIISINYKAELIKAYFRNKKFNIKYIKEAKKLGTAGSLSLMKNEIKSDFFLVNCDVLFDLNLMDIINYHKRQKSDLTIIAAHEEHKVPYGVCEVAKNGRLKAIKEKPNLGLLINTGIYFISKKLLKYIPHKKYDLTDLIKDSKRRNLKVFTYIISSKSWKDLGQKEDLINISKEKILK